MAKKRNQKTKRLEVQIEELQTSLVGYESLVMAIAQLISEMLGQANRDIAELQYENEEQFETDMLQLSTIKRTLSILETALRVAAVNCIKRDS
jgi:ABC-type enterochelin transport system permease subunit